MVFLLLLQSFLLDINWSCWHCFAVASCFLLQYLSPIILVEMGCWDRNLFAIYSMLSGPRWRKPAAGAAQTQIKMYFASVDVVQADILQVWSNQGEKNQLQVWYPASVCNVITIKEWNEISWRNKSKTTLGHHGNWPLAGTAGRGAWPFGNKTRIEWPSFCWVLAWNLMVTREMMVFSA